MTLSVFLQLALMVFLLGIKHGLDPDHLVAIDGMTRYNAAGKPQLARWAGFLFSLGHGAVVVTFAAFLSAATTVRHIPHWTEIIGTMTSVAFLLGMGALNLYSALSTKQHTHTPIAFKGALLTRFFKASSPASILGLGALFAVSFDTLSQAAMFAATTSQSGGWLSAMALALLFTVGMMLPDAVNGFWLSKILRHANTEIQFVSRLMGIVIAGLSLTIGSINLARFFSPSFGRHFEIWQTPLSIALVLIAALVFPAMLFLWRRPMARNNNLPCPAKSSSNWVNK